MQTKDILIGLTGHAGTGKDTAADYLCAEYGFVRASFAGPIKAMAEALYATLGISDEPLHAPALKNVGLAALGGYSSRYLLQTLGTEWGRKYMGHDFWLNATLRAVGLDHGDTPVHDRIVITDVRFPNEARRLKALGGTLIRLHRDVDTGTPAHASEDQINGLGAQITLVNNGSHKAGLHTMLDGAMADLHCAPRPDGAVEPA